MEIRIIKSPSPGTVDILMRRKGSLKSEGRMIEMVVAADIAEKAVGVTVEDIRGSCPQNMILLAIFGDTASVESALAQIKQEAEGGSKYL